MKSRLQFPSPVPLRVAAGVAIAIMLLASRTRSQSPLRYELDGFENENRVIAPNATRDDQKYLWSQYATLGTGTTEFASAVKQSGNKALHSRFLSGNNWQYQFFTYTYDLPGFTNDWQFMRRFVTNPGTYQTGRINRMRFWLKLPPGLAHGTSGTHNFEFGTYIRCSTCTGAETGGNHYYHLFDFASTGVWEQVILDTHPDHVRGGDGNAEQPNLLHPTNEAGFTYYDLMTRFYLDFPYHKFALPADFHIDGVELYEETRQENVDQIRSIHAAYVPQTNEVQLGWRRKKTEDAVKHEVRYAFSDIHSIGWLAATPAPDGLVTPPGTAGYNGMLWSATTIDVVGRTNLYIAIKPQNSALFRQVVVPIAAAGAAPPNNVRVIY